MRPPERALLANTDVLHYLLDIEVIPQSQSIGGSRLEMERSGHARLSVYDASGRLVRTLVDGDARQVTRGDQSARTRGAR